MPSIHGATAGGGRRGEIAALAALLLLSAALNVAPITNNDIFLHLRTGDLVLATGTVPRLDDYSALAAGRPFIAHEWLSGVLFALVRRAFGWNGLVALKVAAAAAIAGILYATARRLGARPAVAIPALAFVMTLVSARIMERPHLFTFVMAALFLWLLARRRAGRPAPAAVFAGLQILWANLHGGFVLGPAIVALAAIAAALDAAAGPAPAAEPAPAASPAPAGTGSAASGARMAEARRLAGLALMLVAACLVNPFGARLLRFPFALTGSSFMDEVYEWLPPWSPSFASTYMARYYLAWIVSGVVVLAAAVVAARRRGTAPPGTLPFLLFAAFLVLSLRMNRAVADFALVTYPGLAATASWLAPARRGRGDRLHLWLIPVLLAAALWSAFNGYAYAPGQRRPAGFGIADTIPVAAADYLEANDLRGVVFNSYASGAYLVDRFHPRLRVAMDSRNDVYGEALYAEYKRALDDPEALRAMLDRIGATVIFFEWPRPGSVRTAAAIRRIGGWRPVHIDDVAVVYLREDGPYGETARRDGYAVLEPALFRPGTLEAADAARALQEAERAVRGGGPYIARVMRIDALVALGREAEAFEDEARILKEAPRLYHIYNYLGLLRLGLGDPQKAAARFRWALELNPRSTVARDGLRRAGASP